MLVTQLTDTSGLLPLSADDRNRLVRLCAYLSSDREVAEDLAQETLLEAWRHAYKLREPSGYMAWLSAIARNVCLRHARRHGRELAHTALPTAAEAGTLPDVEQQPADFDLEIELERDELARLLDRALALLPNETRQVLIARYVQETPVTEVAEQMGLSEGAVTMRLQRGKLALRRVLSTDLQQEAASYGLVDADDWQETRIWCTDCGQRRLVGRFTAEGEFALRCLTCSDEPGAYFSHTRMPGLFKGVKGYKAALSRMLDWSDAYYRQALTARSARCVRCGCDSPIELQLTRFVPASMQGVRGIDAGCPICKLTNYESLSGMALSLPEGRRFWKAHPRIHTLPEREIDAGGEPGLLVRMESVDGRARLDTLFARADYRLLGVYGGGHA